MTNDFVAEELRSEFSGADLFSQVNKLKGETFREVAARRTIKTRIGDRYYFAKIHFGVGWWEIVKNFLQFRLPVLGAGNEYAAIQKLTAAGVPTMTACLYCESGRNPAARCSAILTEALEGKISLEDFETADPSLETYTD